MRLYICIITSEHFLGAGYGQFLGDIHVFAAAVPAFSGVTFGVFVGKHGALHLHYGGAGKILAGDQLDIFLLSGFLEAQHLVHIRIHHFHTATAFKLVHAAFMPAALEIAIHKSV